MYACLISSVTAKTTEHSLFIPASTFEKPSRVGRILEERRGFACMKERAEAMTEIPRPLWGFLYVYISRPYTGGGFLEFKEMVEENSKDKRRKRLHQKELKSKYPYEGRYTKPRQRSYNRSQGKHNNTQEN